jgi:hypothetical protein
MNDSFDSVMDAAQTGGPEAVFQVLAEKFRSEKNYAGLFEVRLMEKRRELALPLLQMGSLDDLPDEKRPEYEKAFIDIARDTGNLFLADGDIPRGFSYLRAIGETRPVYEAIERIAPENVNDAVLEIALHERVHPRKGFELLLESHGVCRAITAFGQFPGSQGREESLHLLVSRLHRDLIGSLKRTIEQAEGTVPEGESVLKLINGRDWLFDGMNYYVDTSHLVSILGFCLELTDPAMLRLAIDLSEYGKRLSPMFHYRSDPPFQNMYEDHGIYLKILLGEDVEAGLAHFRRKVKDIDPEQEGTAAAQILVVLLARLKRYEEAVRVSLQYLAEVDPNQLVCPSVLQLCYLAEDRDKLMQIARERQDLLGFAAGLLAGW